MVTISRVVDRIILESPFIQEALARDIINFVALAEHIHARVEEEMRSSVKISAIAMALRRKQEFLDKPHALHFGDNSDILIKSNLVHTLVKKNSRTIAQVQNIQDSMYSVTQGISEMSILSSDSLPFKKEDIQKSTNNLSGITITIPEEFFNTPGFFYIISRALYLENINIFDMMSTYTELTLIVHENDVAKSFDIIRKVIHLKK